MVISERQHWCARVAVGRADGAVSKGEFGFGVVAEKIRYEKNKKDKEHENDKWIHVRQMWNLNKSIAIPIRTRTMNISCNHGTESE